MNSVFTRRSGELHIENVPLSHIAAKVGTPTYVYSSKAVLSTLRELQKGLEPVDGLVCFAMKANSNLALLRLLTKAGAGMDLVSGGELYKASLVGARGDRVVFSGVGKTATEMKAALTYGKGQKKGILSFNVESVDELKVLQKTAAGLKTVAPVSLRFNPDVDARTHPYIATGLSENKFGLDRRELRDAVTLLRTLPNLQLKGLSIHIGSQLTSLQPLEEAFRSLREVMTELERERKIQLASVDLGGGLAIRYHDETPPPIAEYCRLVEKYFGPGSDIARPLKVVVEPGRLLVGPSGALLTKIIYRKDRSTKRFIIVDAAMNDLLRPALYNAFHRIEPVKDFDGPSRQASIVGPVCETADFLGTDRDLPDALSQGDLLTVMDAGAYASVMASNYNGRPRGAEVLVQGNRFKITRRRETLKDLVRGEAN